MCFPHRASLLYVTIALLLLFVSLSSSGSISSNSESTNKNNKNKNKNNLIANGVFVSYNNHLKTQMFWHTIADTVVRQTKKINHNNEEEGEMSKNLNILLWNGNSIQSYDAYNYDSVSDYNTDHYNMYYVPENNNSSSDHKNRTEGEQRIPKENKHFVDNKTEMDQYSFHFLKEDIKQRFRSMKENTHYKRFVEELMWKGERHHPNASNNHFIVGSPDEQDVGLRGHHPHYKYNVHEMNDDNNDNKDKEEEKQQHVTEEILSDIYSYYKSDFLSTPKSSEVQEQKERHPLYTFTTVKAPTTDDDAAAFSSFYENAMCVITLDTISERIRRIPYRHQHKHKVSYNTNRHATYFQQSAPEEAARMEAYNKNRYNHRFFINYSKNILSPFYYDLEKGTVHIYRDRIPYRRGVHNIEQIREDAVAFNGHQELHFDLDDLLGEAQWAWLEDILEHHISDHAESPPNTTAGRREGRRKKKCAVTIISSPLQFLLNENKPFLGWDLFPFSRSKLLFLLQRYHVERFVFLSGNAAQFAEEGVVSVVQQEKEKYARKIDRLYAERTVERTLTEDTAFYVPNNKDQAAKNYLAELSSGGTTQSAVYDVPSLRTALRGYYSSATAEENEPPYSMARFYKAYVKLLLWDPQPLVVRFFSWFFFTSWVFGDIPSEANPKGILFARSVLLHRRAAYTNTQQYYVDPANPNHNNYNFGTFTLAWKTGARPPPPPPPPASASSTQNNNSYNNNNNNNNNNNDDEDDVRWDDINEQLLFTVQLHNAANGAAVSTFERHLHELPAFTARNHHRPYHHHHHHHQASTAEGGKKELFDPNVIYRFSLYSSLADVPSTKRQLLSYESPSFSFYMTRKQMVPVTILTYLYYVAVVMVLFLLGTFVVYKIWSLVWKEKITVVKLKFE